MANYPWLRLYTSKWLYGSGRLMTPDKRGVWADLLALANESKLRDGTLRHDIGKPMQREWIANVLMLDRAFLDVCLEVFQSDINTDDKQPRVKIWDDGTIELTNFRKYQYLADDGQPRAEKRRTTPKSREALNFATVLEFFDQHPEYKDLVADPKKAVDKLIELGKGEFLQTLRKGEVQTTIPETNTDKSEGNENV